MHPLLIYSCHSHTGGASLSHRRGFSYPLFSHSSDVFLGRLDTRLLCNLLVDSSYLVLRFDGDLQEYTLLLLVGFDTLKSEQVVSRERYGAYFPNFVDLVYNSLSFSHRLCQQVREQCGGNDSLYPVVVILAEDPFSNE